MIIGIDARSLEESTTGVGRYLSNILKCWKDHPEHKFVLYFKNAIPDEAYLGSGNFELRLVKNPFGFSSNFFFQHFLLPLNLFIDKTYFFFSPFYIKPYFCPVKSSVSLHDISYEAHPEWFDSKSQVALRKVSRHSANSADMIFTISQFSKSEIMKYYGVKNEKIVVTYLACDEGLGKINDNDVVRQRIGKYGITGKYVLYIGSIFTRRHVPELINAFERVAGEAKDIPDLQLVVLGRNHTYPHIDIESIIDHANKRMGRRAVAHIDSVEEDALNYFYSGCEFVVYLSDYEGFGLPVVEAQRFDKPVITTRGSSLVESGGNSALFVENNTEAEIYDKMKKLVYRADLKNKLISLGRENLKRFSWKNCAEEILRNIEIIKKEAV